MSYQAQLAGHYADIRSRLYGAPPPAVVRAMIPPPKPVETVVRIKKVHEQMTEAFDRPLGTSVNMLAPPSWRFIVALVAMKYGVHPRDILGTDRHANVIGARHEAMVSVYQHTQGSMPSVARFFDRDHTTLIHAMRKHKAKGKLVDPVYVTYASTADTRIRNVAGRFTAKDSRHG
jgi:hypothetical protein